MFGGYNSTYTTNKNCCDVAAVEGEDFYHLIGFEESTGTSGPTTSISLPNWQLHSWHSGVMYQDLSSESLICTWAPSVADFVQLTA